MIADSKHIDGDSACIESGEAANLGFGRAVKYGSEEGLIAASSGDADKIQGILINRPVEDGVLVDGQVHTVMRKGRVYVQAGEALERGDKAYYVHATGKFGKTAGAGAIELKNCEFKSDAALDELVILDVNLPS